MILGGGERPASITREQPQVDVTYLVTIEKRPEVRKVFPPKIGGPGPAASKSPAPVKETPMPPRSQPADLPKTAVNYTIQIAAVNDAVRARAIVADLKGTGFDAYLVEPSSRGNALSRSRWSVRNPAVRAPDCAAPRVEVREQTLGDDDALRC